MAQRGFRGRTPLKRRRAMQLIGLGGLGMMLAACGAGRAPTAPASAGGTDSAARFAGYAAANEPEGDLAKVVWPEFVTRAGSDIQRLYAFQVTNGALMRYMPCFCGCHKEAGHRNNRDCYIEAVNADGSVVFDSMAPTWGICLGVTRDVIAMLAQGLAPRSIRAEIDRKYAAQMAGVTPTPYPPS